MPKIGDMDKKAAAKTLITRLGGTTKTAKYFGVEPPSVSEWREKGIPKPRMMYLRLAHPEWFDLDGNALPLDPMEAAP
jgi:hypothetical protein